MTIAQLKAFAADNGYDVTATRKSDIVEELKKQMGA